MNIDKIVTFRLNNNIVLKMKIKTLNETGAFTTSNEQKKYLHIYGNTFLLQ